MGNVFWPGVVKKIVVSLTTVGLGRSYVFVSRVLLSTPGFHVHALAMRATI